MSIKRFNVRVYGICFCEKNQLLISKESIGDVDFTKFPGGAVELGEGILDALKREFKEEGDLDLFNIEHFYTTDFFQESAFNKEDQIISIYYTCQANVNWASKGTEQVTHNKCHTITLKKISLASLSEKKFTFPIDKIVFKMLKENNFKI